MHFIKYIKCFHILNKAISQSFIGFGFTASLVYVKQMLSNFDFRASKRRHLGTPKSGQAMSILNSNINKSSLLLLCLAEVVAILH